MARKGLNSGLQMSFADLLDKVDSSPGELVQLPFSVDDFGAELVSILSAGLYTNPLDCIREYCQNSIDAGCESITIKITGSTVSIFDDGHGMSFQGLLQARMFGLSPKDLRQHVGFRGIGIYSGFDLCTTLRITTTQVGDVKGHVLVFDFGAMKAQLNAERLKPLAAGKTSLVSLLSAHTTIGRTQADFPEDRSFTIVELEQIEDHHIQLLSDRGKMRRYLLQNLPLDFDDSFEYRAEINTRLAQEVPGFKAVRVRLESDNLADEVVVKPAIPDLQSPQFRRVSTEGGRVMAFYWSSITKKRERIEAISYESERAGLVYKVKGFSIGDRQKLYGAFSRKPQLYSWVTGEVYVIDSDVTPNAERDDFETNPAKTTLDVLVRASLAELEETVEKHQALQVALKRLEDYEPAVRGIQEAIDAGQILGSEVFGKYSELDGYVRDLSRQKNSLDPTSKNKAVALIALAKKLKEQLSKAVSSTTTSAAKTKTKGAQKKGKPTSQATQGAQATPIQKDLHSLIEDVNLDVGDVGFSVIDAIQQTIDDVLSKGSPVYGTLMNAIEARLVSLAEGE